MSASLADDEQQLRTLLDRTLAEFGPTCLWSLPAALPTRVHAKAVHDAIAKHGGRAGMQRALEIRRALEILGDAPWP